MLDSLFLSVLNMSMTAAFVILAVLLVRLILKKAPKIYSYALWAVVLFRLLCPFSFESKISLLPINKTPIPPDIGFHAEPQINTGLPFVDQIVNSMLPIASHPEASVNPLQIWIFIGCLIWIFGILCILIYSMIQYRKVKRRLIGSTPIGDHIHLADHISCPFVMGIIKPTIYLPTSMTAAEQEFIIAHEQCHIKRLDHITRLLAFIALTIYWFHPLVWVAFILSGRDMELSCDEAVMKKMTADIRAEYSRSLLRYATGRNVISATPLAFGEGDVKNRVKIVMNYKKPMLWVSIAAVIVVICVAVGLVNSPKPKTESISASTKDSPIENLWESRTEYVGDNSAVGNIVGNLPFPEGITLQNIQLDTQTTPFAITVNLKADAKTRNEIAQEPHQKPLQNDAMILFSLIGNVERITFSIDDTLSAPFSLSYASSQAQDILGENYFAKTKTLEGFQTILSKIFGSDVAFGK